MSFCRFFHGKAVNDGYSACEVCRGLPWGPVIVMVPMRGASRVEVAPVVAVTVVNAMLRASRDMMVSMVIGHVVDCMRDGVVTVVKTRMVTSSVVTSTESSMVADSKSGVVRHGSCLRVQVEADD